MNVLLLFNIFDPEDIGLETGAMSAVMRERLIVLGAVLFVVGQLYFWAAFIRKRKRQHSGRHGSHWRRRSSSANAVAGVVELKQLVQEKVQAKTHRHHHRRRRRAHRPRNPTLAETGGLPPVRTGEPPEPPQGQTQPQ